MVENDPKAEENATIKRKYKEKIFFGQFWVFLSILARCGAIFGGPKSKKFRKFFFPESIQNGLKRILNRKSREKFFHPPSNFSRWPFTNFRASLKDPKPVKMGKNIAKKRPYGSGPHYVELFVGHSFGLRPTACQTALRQPDFRCIFHLSRW